MSLRDDIYSILNQKYRSPQSGLEVQLNPSKKVADHFNLYNTNQSGIKDKSINKRTMVSISEMRHHGGGLAALNKTSDQLTFKKNTGLRHHLRDSFSRNANLGATQRIDPTGNLLISEQVSHADLAMTVSQAEMLNDGSLMKQYATKSPSNLSHNDLSFKGSIQ